jgi:L-lactate dehydrogenase (cytochrome)
MRPREIRNLLGLQPPDLNPTRRRLARCHDIEGLRRTARRRTPRAVFDYAEGGADAEVTLAANTDAFGAWRFMPQVLRDVSRCDASAQLFGERFALPLLLSPTGYTRMMHPDGECAVSRAARAAQLPYSLSTVASTSIAKLADTAHPHLWFQLYVWRDRRAAFELVSAALDHGYDALELSVDVPVAGHRTRDVRHGLTIPPSIGARTFLDIAMHPQYWLAMLRSPVIEFANAPSSVGGRVTVENISAQFDPGLDWSIVVEIRERWRRPLLLKGPLSPADARRAIELGVDGIHLSNHGGRQLDRCLPTLNTLPEVRAAIGEDKVLIVDSGIRSGADLAIAICRGADAGAIGRPYLYGLMAGGQAGVERALELLATEFKRTLQLLGVASVRELRQLGESLLVPPGPDV